MFIILDLLIFISEMIYDIARHSLDFPAEIQLVAFEELEPKFLFQLTCNSVFDVLLRDLDVPEVTITGTLLDAKLQV